MISDINIGNIDILKQNTVTSKDGDQGRTRASTNRIIEFQSSATLAIETAVRPGIYLSYAVNMIKIIIYNPSVLWELLRMQRCTVFEG
jgi:hypothetical protein